LVDEFLAKSNVSRCVDFKETADVIAKVFAKLHNNTQLLSLLSLFLYGISSSTFCIRLIF